MTDDPAPPPPGVADQSEPSAAPAQVPARVGTDVAWLSIPLVASIVLSTIGSYTAVTYINERPELALLLSSRPRHLLLSVPAGISLTAYAAIAFVRLAFPLPFAYVLGKRYGGRGLAWLDEQTGGNTGYIGWLERMFRRFSVPVATLFPNLYVGIFAGVERMPLRRYVAASLVGLAGRLALFWWAGKQFSDQLDDVLRFIQKYQWYLLIAAIVIATVQGAWKGSSTRSPRGRPR